MIFLKHPFPVNHWNGHGTSLVKDSRNPVFVRRHMCRAREIDLVCDESETVSDCISRSSQWWRDARP